MVWILTPVDSHAVARPLYLHVPREYTVGRKDGDVVLPNDTSISRLHAKIILKEVPAWQPSRSIPRPELWLEDLSKVGTFLNKQPGTRAINQAPARKAQLHEGHEITFGQGKAIFKLTFLPLAVCLSNSLDTEAKESAEQAARSAGLQVLPEWNDACTHLVESDGATASEATWASVLARKPIVRLEWLEAFVARPSVGAPLPSTASYLPRLRATASSSPGPVSTNEERGSTFGGATFLMASPNQYHPQLAALLRAAGGNVIEIGKSRSPAEISQSAAFVVLPDGASLESLALTKEQATAVAKRGRVEESAMLAAVLAGQVDWSSTQHMPSPAASASTQEMEEEGNEMLEDTAANGGQAEEHWMSSARLAFPADTVGQEDEKPRESDILARPSGASVALPPSPPRPNRRHLRPRPEPVPVPRQPRVEAELEAATPGAPEEVRDDHQGKPPSADADAQVSSLADVILRQLIVKAPAPGGRPAAMLESTPVSPLDGVANFKVFRKGGSNGALQVPRKIVALKPFRDEESLRLDMAAFARAEKKRKEAERSSEELFANDKLKRVKAAANHGSVLGGNSLQVINSSQD